MGLLSVKFFAFVALALICYYAMPVKKYKWTVLLTFSMAYYVLICNKYIIYMIVTIITTYIGTRLIDHFQTTMSATVKANKEVWDRATKSAYKKSMNNKAKASMILTLVINFGILGFLKYFGFAEEVVAGLLGVFGFEMEVVDLGLLLPLGISFYTFQTMGYVIDVYQEKVSVEKNIFRLALFVSFFPQIIQGPIAMYSDLANELYVPHKFDYDRFKRAFLLILWGAFKKLVIADRAVHMITVVCDDISEYSGTYLLLAALIYALQLYADFSGGIDIVRGIGEMFGITMAENFRRPYFSRSLTEYWHRWHITLGNWVRNYVFYPLSISKKFLKWGKWLTAHWGKHFGRVIPTSVASLITFLIIGIWHGANGKYVAFGLWNGVVIMIGELISPLTEKLKTVLKVKEESRPHKYLCIVWTFILVLVGYYFDIAQSFSDAWQMIKLSITDFHISEVLSLTDAVDCGLDFLDYLVILLGAVIIFVVSYIQEKKGIEIREWILERRFYLRWIILYICIFTVLIFGNYGPGIDPADFVYMQF